MNITTQIETVGRFPEKPWTGRDGCGRATWFIEGTFNGGRKFSQAVWEEVKAKELHDALTGLIGKDGDFEVEETDREYKGQREYKLKSYPGKPQYQGAKGAGGFSGGGRPFSGGAVRYRDTEGGVKEERDSIIRQVALKSAVESLESGGAVDVLQVADQYYKWLASSPGASKPIPLPTGAGSVPAQTEGEAYTKYMTEIAGAVKAQDYARLDKLRGMIAGSLDKGSVSLDEASNLNDELVGAAKALASSAELNNWVKRKQAEASKNEPRHANSAMNQTMVQAEDVF